MTLNQITGKVLRIEKCSIHDGDGLRTVVFLQGCPLHCAWCSTPEAQDSFMPNVGYGKTMTAESVINEIAKDEIFFFHSGGGVTISGGEPLTQPEFTQAILSACKKMGINTAMETCAFGEYEVIEKLLPYLDLIYTDIKLMDDEQHIKWTGASNKTILENIKRLSHHFPDKLRIRVPFVPTVNSDDDSIRAIAEFCQSLGGIDLVELLPYHRLGLETYRKLGREMPLSDIMPSDSQAMETARRIFKEITPDIVVSD